MKKLSIILSLAIALTLGIDFNMKDFQPNGTSINQVTAVEASNFCWAVGDSGRIFKLNTTGYVVVDSILNAEYNLTGVSFAPFCGIGYIVGYKRDNPEKWKGAVWKTTDGGQSWTQLTYEPFPGNVPTPFLDVCAVDENNAWISCGHGYVLITRNSGQSWSRTHQKPGGPNHFGWLWGIDAPDENTA